MVHVVSTCTWRNGKHGRMEEVSNTVSVFLWFTPTLLLLFFFLFLLLPPSPLPLLAPPLFFYVFVYSFPFHPPLCTSFLSGNIWRWRSMNGRKRLFLPPCDLTSATLVFSIFLSSSLSLLFSSLRDASSREDANRSRDESWSFRWSCKVIFHRANRNQWKEKVSLKDAYKSFW